MYFPRAY